MPVPHQRYLEAAIKEARQSLAQGGIPIGAVLVYQAASHLKTPFSKRVSNAVMSYTADMSLNMRVHRD